MLAPTFRQGLPSHPPRSPADRGLKGLATSRDYPWLWGRATCNLPALRVQRPFQNANLFTNEEMKIQTI